MKFISYTRDVVLNCAGKNIAYPHGGIGRPPNIRNIFCNKKKNDIFYCARGSRPSAVAYESRGFYLNFGQFIKKKNRICNVLCLRTDDTCLPKLIAIALRTNNENHRVVGIRTVGKQRNYFGGVCFQRAEIKITKLKRYW